MPQSRRKNFARHWMLDPDVTFLNHGSFGACPKPVLEYQNQMRARMERQPVQFFARDLEGLLDEARTELAAFLHARPEDVVWVPNATAGVNAVLRSMRFEVGDELLTTDHEYNACRNVLDFVAERTGARVVVAHVPFPTSGSEEVKAAILDRVTDRTRLALLDHVTSQTALILPVAELVAELEARGVDTLVDGAHAPGMLDLDVTAIGAAYYTGNCHKWLCAPKGAAFLHVRCERQPAVRPISISHGANSPRQDRSRFLIEFDWVGTDDPTACLSVPFAIRFIGSLLPGGWPAIRDHNHDLVSKGREMLCDLLGLTAPCPEAMLGSIASLPLPDGSDAPPTSALYADPLQDELLANWRVEVPVIPWPASPQRLVRISAQIFNVEADYQRLAAALAAVLG